MEETTEPLVVGVRFSKVGKIYHFATDTINDIKVGDNVVVETSRGWQLGQVAQIVPNPEPPPEGWKPIDRRATPRDLLLRQMWQMKEAEVVANCKTRSVELRLNGIKIISSEYSFDGSRLSIFFNSETEEKYDLKSLRSDMQKAYAPSQVEMRQIGPRDVAKSVCGMGACGLETRCCCLFLTEFSSISIRMAKEQGISLTPTEITGMCGRLRCCLIYEYDTYVDARSRLPKRNKRVRTPEGEGKVVDVVPLRGAVIVELPEVGYKEFNGSDVQVLDASGEPIPTPPEKPLYGTEQASTMDQAITGDTTEKNFVIGPGTPPGSSPWDNPPAEDQPRSMPRPDRPQRQNAPRRSERDQSRQPSPGLPGTTGGQPERGGRRDRPQGPRPGGKGMNRSGHPQRPGQQDSDRNTPPNASTTPGGTENITPAGNQPRPPRAGGGSGGPGGKNANRDQRNRKGRRRDNNDTENRA